MKTINKGMKMGRWTVLCSLVESTPSKRKWLCRCDCGTERYVLERSLLYGGSYDNIADAVNARKEAEDTIFGGTTAYYEKWNEAANQKPGWAEENPIQIEIGRDSKDKLTITFYPPLEEITEFISKGNQITDNLSDAM